jgi:hypothetical protein
MPMLLCVKERGEKGVKGEEARFACAARKA